MKNPPTGKRSVIYLSDTHLFWAGRRKLQKRETQITLENLTKVCAKYDVVVLNGDIFELPFSNLGFSRTVARAVSVLEFMLKVFPNTQIHYTIGNHDADPVFVYELKKLALEHKNFQVTEKHLLLDGWLSLHGDIPENWHKEREKKKNKDKDPAEIVCDHPVPFHPLLPPQRSANRLPPIVAKEVQRKGDRTAKERIPLPKWAKQIDEYLSICEPELYTSAHTFVLGHTHRKGKHEVEGKDGLTRTFLNTGVGFDWRRYKQVDRFITDAAYTEYCARVKETPVSDTPALTTDSALTALEKIEHERKIRTEELAEIDGKPERFIKGVYAISKMYEEGSKKTDVTFKLH